ncbi:MAG: undecaprenyl-diphosphate phosphatase [Hyphomicrobiales bacterium]
MSIEQIIILAIVQGITEFLPISSSGHLILVPVITGWKDQGLLTDVMVHMGSFLAVVVYFWRDVIKLFWGGIDLLRLRFSTTNAKMALWIILATIPAVIFGLYMKKSGLIDELRGASIVAWNAIIFGILLYIADLFGPKLKRMEELGLKSALTIGLAQALAIIPGTSRSGITMTAGRALGLTRPEAARFSFLLGIPAIGGAGVLFLGDAIAAGETISSDVIWAALLTFFSAIAAIAFLMALVKRISFLPFVIYRVALGIILLVLIANGTIS